MHKELLELSSLTAISAIDGRYANKTAPLREYFSEFALIKARIEVEIEWLKKLASTAEITELANFSAEENKFLQDILINFDVVEAQKVKDLEKTTNHDVKAVEYYLQEKLQTKFPQVLGFIHFACTSEDINNLSYALILQRFRTNYLLPELDKIITWLQAAAVQYADKAMLARTHGQAATPTTVGKEFAVFHQRLVRQREFIATSKILGKINGAVGNFNAHQLAYPAVDWIKLSSELITSLGLEPNLYTTQIEPHDYMVELFDAVRRSNVILIDFCRDIWGYIALGYFGQELRAHEVGSSTMPHKVNPIDFENGEGNLGLANALFGHFAEKLPISRWQRDLSDSTVSRSLGLGMAYSIIAYESISKGLGKIKLLEDKLQQDLDANWEVLAEALQTVMRRYGINEPYEKLKKLTRGQKITAASLGEFIQRQDLPEAVKQQLSELTPHTYTGLAQQLAKFIGNK